jgi:uncharacterized membrane protein
MGRIIITRLIAAPVETVFAYVDDYRNTTKYMKDLSKWQPTGDKTHGKGSEFEVGMRAGPTTLTSMVLITHWTENRVIGWSSQSGFKQSGKWQFRSKGEDTEATFEMEYEFGGGIAGRMLGRAAEPIVRGNLEQSVAALKTNTEKLAAKGGGASQHKPAAKSAGAKTASPGRARSGAAAKR